MKNTGILATSIVAFIGFSSGASLLDAKTPIKLELVESSLKIRSLQTRAFDTTDENKTLRAIIATLQDFSFVIKKADEELGTITARRIDRYSLRLTVTVRRRGETQVLVRMNAHYGQPIRDPITYRDFFASLANSMFLTANAID